MRASSLIALPAAVTLGSLCALGKVQQRVLVEINRNTPKFSHVFKLARIVE